MSSLRSGKGRTKNDQIARLESSDTTENHEKVESKGQRNSIK